MLQIIRQRSQVEKSEEFDPLIPSSQKAQNRITIDDLYVLLEQRKLYPADQSAQQMKSYSEKFRLNEQSIQALHKYVNNITPLDVGSDDDRKRGVWVDNRDDLERYAERAKIIAKKREESRKVDKPEKTTESHANERKKKELEELFID
jgi:hypothetical protein